MMSRTKELSYINELQTDRSSKAYLEALAGAFLGTLLFMKAEFGFCARRQRLP
jgi:hypothetical protein